MSNRATLPETDLCRLSIVTPAHVLELALPTAVPVADFLPAVLSFAGPGLADAGLAHDGWILQRLGGAPLAAARTLAELGVQDGETLYLRARQTAAPEAVFDDVVDGLATAVREREDRLRETAGRWGGPLLGAVLLTGGALSVLHGPGAAAQRAGIAAAAAVLLVITAAIGGRLLRARAARIALGIAAVEWAAVGGWLGADALARGGAHPESMAALWSGAAALLASILAVAVTADPRAGGEDTRMNGLEPFATTIIIATGTVLAAGLAVGCHLALSRTAAVASVVGLGFVLAVPTLAFRLIGQRLPALPVTAERIQVDLPARDRTDLWQVSAHLDRLMGALLAGCGVLAVGGATLTAGHGPLGAATAADLGLALLLRGRVFARTSLRLLMQAAGTVTLAIAAWRASAVAHAAVTTVGIAAAALVLGLAASSVGPRRQTDDPPYAARAADIADYLVLAALIPLALAVFGAFGWARGLAG